jgi:hypothetical protein
MDSLRTFIFSAQFTFSKDEYGWRWLILRLCWSLGLQRLFYDLLRLLLSWITAQQLQKLVEFLQGEGRLRWGVL